MKRKQNQSCNYGNPTSAAEPVGVEGLNPPSADEEDVLQDLTFLQVLLWALSARPRGGQQAPAERVGGRGRRRWSAEGGFGRWRGRVSEDEVEQVAHREVQSEHGQKVLQ